MQNAGSISYRDKRVRAVRASTKDEAVAFIIASAMQFETKLMEQFMSRTLVVDTLGNFHGTRINKTDLNIIAKLHDSTTAYSAASEHHVLLAIGPEDEINSQDVITLPRLDRDGQVNALKEMGLSRDEAERKSRECGRDLTILRTLIGFPPPPKNFTDKESITNLLPALLVGRWNENSDGDKAIIEQLSGQRYDEYIDRLYPWLEIEGSPLIKIAETWRLASPWDAWATFSRFLTKGQFDELKTICLNVLGEINPALSLDPDKRYMASVFGKTSAYSSWLKEGLHQTLILIAVKGENLKLRDLSSPQAWVDDLVATLMKGATGELWSSLNAQMPLLAEASPSLTMHAIENSLLDDEKHILKMFEEEASIIAPTSRHTGLLWALEGLAWDKKYFHQASMLLLKLSLVDPGGTLANRPLHSLVEIFLPWHYQTFASFDQRMKTLEGMLKQHHDVAWRLAISLLPTHHAVAQNTHRMRWRTFDGSFELVYTWNDIFATHTAVLKLLLQYTDFSEQEISAIVDVSDHFRPNDRKTLLEFIENNAWRILGEGNLVWHSLRKVITHHSEFPGADWALAKEELGKYNVLLTRFEPQDFNSKLIWQFTEHWPVPLEKAENFRRASFETQQEIIDQIRVDHLTEVYHNKGLSKLLELIPLIKEHWAFGAALASVIDDDQEILQILLLLKGDDIFQTTAQGFINAKRSLKGLDWAFKIYERSGSLGLTFEQRAKILTTFPQARDVWDYLSTQEAEIEQQYWQQMQPWFWRLSADDRIFGLRKLIDVKRFRAAINVTYHNLEGLPSSLMVDLLVKIATEKTDEKVRPERHPIEMVLDELERRSDIDRGEMITLEWYYLPLLASTYSNHKPVILHEELSSNPRFFVDVLKWTYRPEDERQEAEQISAEATENRARSGFDLLQSWKKVPGSDEHGQINSEKLNTWIDEARSIAKEEGRLRVADAQIGHMLAQYPEKPDQLFWPPLEIAAVIDRLNTSSLKSNFSAAVNNKRGATSRAAFAGGEIERGQAAYFQDLASKLRESFPVTALILSDIADNYLSRAKRQDETAEREKLDT